MDIVQELRKQAKYHEHHSCVYNEIADAVKSNKPIDHLLWQVDLTPYLLKCLEMYKPCQT